jgi:hypothetical protein
VITHVLEDEDQRVEFTIDHLKFQPSEEFVEGKRCRFCGDTRNWGWAGVVWASDGKRVKKVGKVLLCQQCLINGGWLSGISSVQHRDGVGRGDAERGDEDPSSVVERSQE